MPPLSRRLLLIGCWLLVVTGGLHLVGHFSPPPEPASAEEAEMLRLADTVHRDLGAGFSRTLRDFVTGFSLAYGLWPLFVGWLGLVVARRAPGDAILLRRLALVAGLAAGAQTLVAARYFFLPPLVLYVLCSLVLLAAATARVPAAASRSG
jgi:hypothetical protein